MPVTYQIDAENATIRTRCVGDVTLEEVIHHFHQLALDPDCPGRLGVLLDLSEETTIPKSNELRAVACAIGKVRTRVQFGACAIVAPRDALYGMLRVFEVFAENLFSETRVFRSLDEAEQWLAARSLRRGQQQQGSPRTSGGGK